MHDVQYNSESILSYHIQPQYKDEVSKVLEIFTGLQVKLSKFCSKLLSKHWINLNFHLPNLSNTFQVNLFIWNFSCRSRIKSIRIMIIGTYTYAEWENSINHVDHIDNSLNILKVKNLYLLHSMNLFYMLKTQNSRTLSLYNTAHIHTTLDIKMNHYYHILEHIP